MALPGLRKLKRSWVVAGVIAVAATWSMVSASAPGSPSWRLRGRGRGWGTGGSSWVKVLGIAAALVPMAILAGAAPAWGATGESPASVLRGE